ncbi:hypothetical protein CDL15_Pgr019821 [Punica granatum]|uniref:ABC transmembrane type-1 domain-containing protein n=1 Tax=Punica granatum TaxID=22663 RepID=A0A218X7Q4_PUNGR|nr:hypothetical protein CDL15_Pgr019821 [Punica granatum]
MVVTAILGLIFPVFGLLIGLAIQSFYKPPNELIEDSEVWALIFFGLGIITLVAYPVQGYFFGSAGGRIIQRIRYLTFQKVVQEEMSGAIGVRLSTNASILSSLVGDTLSLLIQNSVTIMASLMIAIIANWKLALILLASSPPLFLKDYVQAKYTEGSAQTPTMRKPVVGNDAVVSIRTVASFCAENKMMDLYQKKCETPKKPGVRLGLTSVIGYRFSCLAMYCRNALCFYIGAILVKHGQATFGEVFEVFFSLTISALAISQSSAWFPDPNKAKDSATSIFKILDSKSKIDSSVDDGMTLLAITGNLDLEHINFKYPTRPGVEIFKDLCLHMPTGKEATNALGEESEQVVQDTLERVMMNRNAVAVAHPLKTIKNSDIISVIKDGVIAEQGSHGELMKITEGAYASLLAIHAN